MILLPFALAVPLSVLSSFILLNLLLPRDGHWSSRTFRLYCTVNEYWYQLGHFSRERPVVFGFHIFAAFFFMAAMSNIIMWPPPEFPELQFASTALFIVGIFTTMTRIEYYAPRILWGTAAVLAMLVYFTFGPLTWNGTWWFLYHMIPSMLLFLSANKGVWGHMNFWVFAPRTCRVENPRHDWRYSPTDHSLGEYLARGSAKPERLKEISMAVCIALPPELANIDDTVGFIMACIILGLVIAMIVWAIVDLVRATFRSTMRWVKIWREIRLCQA